MAGFRGQRTAHADEVRTPEHVFQANQLNAKLGGELRIRVRVVRDQSHLEGLDEPKEFGPDIAYPDRSERASHQTQAHVIAPFGETGRGFARQPVLDHELASQR